MYHGVGVYTVHHSYCLMINSVQTSGQFWSWKVEVTTRAHQLVATLWTRIYEQFTGPEWVNVSTGKNIKNLPCCTEGRKLKTDGKWIDIDRISKSQRTFFYGFPGPPSKSCHDIIIVWSHVHHHITSGWSWRSTRSCHTFVSWHSWAFTRSSPMDF